jgi:hypothetical protein
MSGTKRSHRHPTGHTVPVGKLTLNSDEMMDNGHIAARKAKMICDLVGIGHNDWFL